MSCSGATLYPSRSSGGADIGLDLIREEPCTEFGGALVHPDEYLRMVEVIRRRASMEFYARIMPGLGLYVGGLVGGRLLGFVLVFPAYDPDAQTRHDDRRDDECRPLADE
jgi:hypothetical protein